MKKEIRLVGDVRTWYHSMEEWTLVDLHGNSHTRHSWFLKCGDPYPATGSFFAPPTNEIRKDWHFLGSFSFSFWLQHCLDLCLMSFWVPEFCYFPLNRLKSQQIIWLEKRKFWNFGMGTSFIILVFSLFLWNLLCLNELSWSDQHPIEIESRSEHFIIADQNYPSTCEA